MIPKKKLIQKFVKIIVKNTNKKADLRTLKIFEFTNKNISYSFLFDTKKMTCAYIENPAEELYNLFLEFEQEILAL
jgi:hypothetical protein